MSEAEEMYRIAAWSYREGEVGYMDGELMAIFITGIQLPVLYSLFGAKAASFILRRSR